jgi:helicase
MIIVVQPLKGNYKLLYLDGKQVRGVGIVDVAETDRGFRPANYRLRWGGKKAYRNTPTKDLIADLRDAEVILSRPDEPFESFLRDFQVTCRFADLCRMCLLDDRVTQLKPDEAVRYGKSGEKICFDCAKRELRREAAHLGHLGRSAMGHLDELLMNFRDVDKVLATLQPEQLRMKQTLFDRLEAHPPLRTQTIDELPLPRQFIDAAGVDHLMPAQQLAVEAGLLYGKDLLIVSATASGKTFIGEMAGMKNYLQGRGRFLFLVPLVALANQKYERFRERYGNLAKVGLLTGVSRLNLPETRQAADRDSGAPILVGTYEGIDHMIRCGTRLKNIGTVVIDEVQMLEDPDRGHRLDGLTARIKYLAPKAQFLYLSATIGIPKTLAGKLRADLVRYDERPVPLERYLLFLERRQKIPTIKTMVTREYRNVSSKGYRGQSIVFTNSRARCHLIAGALGIRAAAYHAGLTAQERRDVEQKFLQGRLMAVVTTAALGAGVDFPASQVIFDSLAMGRCWLTVQEFNQMAGRAGRPDFHDLGKIVILAEPGGTYSRDEPSTEEEVALRVLKGAMEEVAPEHDIEQSSEEYVANAVVCGGDGKDLARIEKTMVGTMEPALPILLQHGLVKKAAGTIELTDLARVMAEHFIGVEHLLLITQMVREMDDPLAIVAELDCRVEEELERLKKERGKGRHRKR